MNTKEYQTTTQLQILHDSQRVFPTVAGKIED